MTKIKKIVVIENDLNIGAGFYSVGRVFDVLRETSCFYILKDNRSVNKKHMAIAGTATPYSVKVELFIDEIEGATS